MILKINEAFKWLEPYLPQIVERFDKEGTVIYKARNTIKVFNVAGLEINIKRYRRPALLNRVVYTFFKKSKAERSYENSRLIRERGFKTPDNIAFMVMKKWGLISDSYYFSTQENYPRSMYEFGTEGMEGKEAILSAFARYTAQLHGSEILHRDYSPGNILFKEEGGELKFCLVDLNRVSFGEVGLRKGCRNFARLWGDVNVFNLMADEYAKERNCDSRQVRRWMLDARRRFWTRYIRKHPAPPFEI